MPGAKDGTTTLIWNKPTAPCVRPAKATAASCEPIVAVTGSAAFAGARRRSSRTCSHRWRHLTLACGIDRQHFAGMGGLRGAIQTEIRILDNGAVRAIREELGSAGGNRRAIGVSPHVTIVHNDGRGSQSGLKRDLKVNLPRADVNERCRQAANGDFDASKRIRPGQFGLFIPHDAQISKKRRYFRGIEDHGGTDWRPFGGIPVERLQNHLDVIATQLPALYSNLLFQTPRSVFDQARQ